MQLEIRESLNIMLRLSLNFNASLIEGSWIRELQNWQRAKICGQNC